MRTKTIFLSTTLALVLGATAAVGQSQGKGGGKPDKGNDGGAGEQVVEVPTTVFIQRTRNTPPSLVVAGANSEAAQTIYNFSNYHANLHDAVLVGEGHGRALITDRSGDPLPLVLVDFWFDANGLVTSSSAQLLTERIDWGCEALSSDGTRAIYAPGGYGKVWEIDIASGTERLLWSMEESQAYAACDYQSENALNGILHTIVYDFSNKNYRIDRINLTDDSKTTVVTPRPDLSGLAVLYSGSSVVGAAFDSPEGIRIGSTFSDAAASEVTVTDGRYPDFYCDGQTILLRQTIRMKRTTSVLEINGETKKYADWEPGGARTLC